MRREFLSIQAYPFMQRAQQSGIEWADAMGGAIAESASAGLNGWEPIVRTPDQVAIIVAAAGAHGLSVPSLYVGGAMHEEAEGRATVVNMLSIAREAARLGTRFVVINPNPIEWGSTVDKTDLQLRCQLRLLAELGREMTALGLKLCYHTHDAEMRASAREFHHMLTETNPSDVRLCLDPHWIYRGAGNSEIALHDIMTHYGDRIEIVHLRQSQNGIWDETVGPGDLDYIAIMERIAALRLSPLMVLERAVEAGTPKLLGDHEAYRVSADYVRNQLIGRTRRA